MLRPPGSGLTGVDMLKGFLFSAVEAGIKAPGRLDLGLIHSQRPAENVCLFTTNTVGSKRINLFAIGLSR